MTQAGISRIDAQDGRAISPADAAAALAEATPLLALAAIALERAGATLPLAHLEQVIALVETRRG